MKFVITPNEFPPVRYYFLGNVENTELLKKIISMGSPQSCYIGHIDNADEINITEGDHIVMCDPFWLNSVANLSEDKHRKLILFPIPKDDYWGYWEAFKFIIHKFEIDDTMTISDTDFVNYLVSLGRAILDKHGRKEFGWRYPLLRRGLRLKRRGAKGLMKYVPDIDRYGVLYKNYFLKGNYPALHTNQINKHITEINFIRNRLSDQRSQDSYTKILFASPNILWEHYINGLLTSLQYFDYLMINPGDVIINCGVHSGSEIPIFLAHLKGKGEIHHIDPIGFDYLSEYASNWIASFKELNIEYKMALHNETGRIALSTQHDGQLCQVQGYENEKMAMYPSVTLEDFIKKNRLKKVDIIKFDLEGAEETVIPTLQNVVNKYRPQLAVSIYHKTCHLWELPMQLIKMCPNYDFYLNFYCCEQYEVIFYCIPHEKNPNKNRLTIRLEQ